MEEKKCHLYRINGVEDHIHIATHVHPTIALADLVKAIKVSSAVFIKEQGLFPKFKAWQEGYGAFTYSIQEKETLIAYIKNQEAHHEKISFKDEYIALLKEHGISFDERYLL
jgi:REP element-mobilizing transposase RayT